MFNENLKYWLAFNQTSFFRNKHFLFYLSFFDSLESFWSATLSALLKSRIPEKIAQHFIFQKSQVDPNQELDKLIKSKLQVLLYSEADYPALLKEIYQPPLLLFYSGHKNILQQPALAIVGTRNYSYYGQAITTEMTSEAIRNNLIPVSGLAVGIDTLVHQTCLENNFPTIAILGSGLDHNNLYPYCNINLATKIVNSGGLIMSEYNPGTKPQKHYFPQRNRLISGLSLGTLVIEAREKSGALITARWALEQNREIFAVPGRINQHTSQGTNNLIKRGAKLVTSFQDILEELNLPQKLATQKLKAILPITEAESLVLKHLDSEPKHINEIASLCQQSITQINAQLLLLEIKGLVKNIGQMKYIISKT